MKSALVRQDLHHAAAGNAKGWGAADVRKNLMRRGRHDGAAVACAAIGESLYRERMNVFLYIDDVFALFYANIRKLVLKKINFRGG